LELGTGCGIVGITLASLIPNCSVALTDLPEAREIVEKNISHVLENLAPGATLSFDELDWDADLPARLKHADSKLDIVLAADCTYNPDSRYVDAHFPSPAYHRLTCHGQNSPVLVNTLNRLAAVSPAMLVAIAMKMRHSSEQVFFELMADAGFRETAKLEFKLPGDVQLGEETVYLHVYRHGSSV
jgi:hypothetical protein